MCVFKYLATHEDPQKWYSISVLIVNSISLFLISISYLTVGIRATISAKKSMALSQAACKEHNKKRDRRMQIKISAIILTDLVCWLPFTIVCFLHFGDIINATPWYPIFSVIMIPINSVINPLLYSAETFKIFITYPIKLIKDFLGFFSLSASLSIRSQARQEIGYDFSNVTGVSHKEHESLELHPVGPIISSPSRAEPVVNRDS